MNNNKILSHLFFVLPIIIVVILLRKKTHVNNCNSLSAYLHITHSKETENTPKQN